MPRWNPGSVSRASLSNSRSLGNALKARGSEIHTFHFLYSCLVLCLVLSVSSVFIRSHLHLILLYSCMIVCYYYYRFLLLCLARGCQACRACVHFWGTSVHHRGVWVSHVYGYESEVGYENPWLELYIYRCRCRCRVVGRKQWMHLDVHADVCVCVCGGSFKHLKVGTFYTQLYIFGGTQQL